MQKLDEQILRTSKEIIVKFIETGRVSPTGFPDTFKTVYRTIRETVVGAVGAVDAGGNEEQDQGK